MQFDFEKFCKNVQQLKINREKVPRQELKTRYANSYNALIRDIRHQTWEMIKSIVFSDPVDQEEATRCGLAYDTYIKHAASILNSDSSKQIIENVFRIVLRNYDVVRAAQLVADSIGYRIRYEAYAPYWLTHCKLAEGGGCYNDLIDMTWHETYNVWTNDAGEFMAALPPTAYLIREEAKQWRSEG